MTYLLRLIENDTEVGFSTVARRFEGGDYPSIGQTIDDTWLVLGVISYSEEETCVRVTRINSTKPQEQKK